MRTVLIDGDITVYKIAMTAEKPIKWDDDLWTLHAHEQPAVAALHEEVERIREACEATHVIIALTDTVNFRKSILPTYKSNRNDKRKPMLIPALRQVMIDEYNAYIRPGLEGDDILGILSTNKAIVKGERLIWSLDKDMYTIPGLFCRALTEDGKAVVTEVTEAEADRFHLYQTLIGDVVDGYSGCPGIGPVAANKILDDPWRLERYERVITRGKNKGQTQTVWEPVEQCTQWEAIVSQYERAGLNEHVALQNARVARILRNSDYDFTKKEPILWTPN